ncbi:MAG TPA: hypothetical protein VFU69_18645 [Ktedonobacterales bacterium]|nr:hypothetical protein [Ktedonobacterales bacterium]
MSKDGALQVMDPPTNTLKDTLPPVEILDEVKDISKQAITEVNQISLRTGKTIKGWWLALPNDGVRAAIVAGFGVVISLIPVLVAIYRRRNAP